MENNNSNLVPVTITIMLPEQDANTILAVGKVNGYEHPTAVRFALMQMSFLRHASGKETVGMVRELWNMWGPYTAHMLKELQGINPKIGKLGDKWYPKELEDGTNRLDWLGKLLGFNLPPKSKRIKTDKQETTEEVETFE